MKTFTHSPSSHQRGMALVVGLIMLVVLTLLAVTSMSTSTNELLMAGGEQVRQNAMIASEIGIERRMQTLQGHGTASTAPIAEAARPVPGAVTDTFATTATYCGEDGNVYGNSNNKFRRFHFRIQSTGNAARNTSNTLEVGVWMARPGGGNANQIFGSSAALLVSGC